MTILTYFTIFLYLLIAGFVLMTVGLIGAWTTFPLIGKIMGSIGIVCTGISYWTIQR